MATGEDSLALPSGEPEVAENPLGVFSRPRSTSGFAGWLTSVDHKRIAIMYGGAALFFLLWGGAPALLIRLQLALPNNTMLSEDAYNQISTTHGTVMVFLFAMPMAAAFANYLMPLQVGARNVAFPRLNAYSFWVFLLGGIMLNTSWFLGGAPKGGWFNYAPDNGLVFSPSAGIDLWNVGLLIAGIGSLTSAINLIVTALNMRAPGMTLMKMPLFVW
ncbi:MAG: cytochrome ubiquinol oxidase subunit I, partial [Actinomycetia bacterium]|nr:cytochrome ubiquinol oxidase subunit I [Actinomycetes bacterium]